jgi:hypothetical protein
MSITVTKTKLTIAILALALVIPATAWATHVFDDVDDARFYADPIEWAADNGITTGTSPTTFEPDRGVTRGESVTFLKRYHDNLVTPAIGLVPVAYAAVQADGTVVAARSAGLTTDNVSLDSTSAFCFENLDFDFTSVQVAPLYVGDEATTTIEVGYAETMGFGLDVDCDSADAELEIATLLNGIWVPRGFTIVFYA